MRRRRILVVLAVVMGLSLAWIIFATTRPIKPYARLWHAEGVQTNSRVPCAIFYVTNLSDRTIAFGGRHVETRVNNAWHLCTNCTVRGGPNGPFRGELIGPFQSESVVVERPPTQEEWRLELSVSREARGLCAIPAWLHMYKTEWRQYKSWLGWKVWKWPPFGKTIRVTIYGEPLKLTSEAISEGDSDHQHVTSSGE